MTKIEDISPTSSNTTFPNGQWWQSVNGRVLALACSQDGQVVFAGSYSNMWASEDGGQTWDQIVRPQPAPGQFGTPGSMGGWCVMDIAVSPQDWHTVLAITRNDRERKDRGIWRSKDGGNNWVRVHQFPAGETVGQLVWAPGSDRLVYAAGGSALAISHDGGATFQNVFPWGAGPLKRVNHIAVSSSRPTVSAPQVVYALGDSTMFVSFDGGVIWIQDSGSIPPGAGGAVGTANSRAPSVLVVSPRSPLEVFLVANDAVLWRGDYTQFSSTHQSSWQPVVQPNLGDQDSGNVFIAATQPGHGNLLFYGPHRSKAFGGPLDPVSASDWRELDETSLVHVDLHGIFLSPDFEATLQNSDYQVSAGTVWLLSDGGIYWSIDGGKNFKAAQNVTTLSCVNVAGVARKGVGTALSLNTGDNDGFYSLDGGTNWTSQDYGGGDNDCSYADPLTPHRMLVFTPRWDGTVTLYKDEQGGLPDARILTTQRYTVPGPPQGTTMPDSPTGPPAWNAGSTFGMRGSRPIVLTKPDESVTGDGDYVFVQFKTDERAVLLRTESLLAIESPDDWDTPWMVFNHPSAQTQIGGNTTNSTPFVTPDGWVYFQGTDDKLWKVFNDGSQQTQIGSNTTNSTPFVTPDGWVYFQGTDDKLWKVFNDGSQQTQIGGNTTAATPFVTPDGWVYFRGTDDKLWKVFNDGSQQTQIGGNTTASTPFVTPDGWVYFQGTDDKLWKVFNNGSQQTQIGGNTTKSTPFVTPFGWVYFQGTDDKLWKVFNDGRGQMQIGSNTTASTPFVTRDGWVYFRGTDDKLWKVFNDGSQQTQIGGNTTASTPFVTRDGWVYFQGTDDKLWKVFVPFKGRRGVYQQGPALPHSDLGVVQASGGSTGTVFYVGGNGLAELWKWTEGMTNWELLVPGIGAAQAHRFFVDPYRPTLIYLLDERHVKRSDDGGKTWHVDPSLEKQLSCGGRIPIERRETSGESDQFVEVVLSDMQFDPHRSLTRFAVGEGGAFFTNDGVNWNRLLDTGAMPGRPTNCYYDWVSNPCERALYVAFAGRSLVRISPLPWGALQAPDPNLWSTNQVVQGRQSKSTPAVAVFQGLMHMVHNDGQSNALIWTTSADGLNWDPGQTIPGQNSEVGASIAEFGGVLHMVHLRDSSNDIWWSTNDGTGWTDRGQIPGQLSQTLPALVSFHGEFFMVHTGDANRIFMWKLVGNNWVKKTVIKGQLSKSPVKLAVFQEKIHMVHLGDSSNEIWWSVFDGSGWWSSTMIRCQKSQSVPALATHNGLLHMVHQGDGSNSMWWSLYDGDEWTPNVMVPGQTSKTTAALCETTDHSQLAMLHLGESSDEIWFSAV